MGAFFCRRDREGVERWWLEVTGKGSKTRLVPATDEVMMELARYREAYGLPPMPLPGEDRPIVPPIIGKEKPLSHGALHPVLKEIFAMAAGRLRVRARVGFGHASISTTSAYLHREDDARHEATQKHHPITWKR